MPLCLSRNVRRRVFGSTVLALIAAATVGRAATLTWTGGYTVDDSWQIAENWAGHLVPTAGDDLVFPISGSPTLNRTAENTINNLAINRITLGMSDFVISGSAINLQNGIRAEYSGVASRIGNDLVLANANTQEWNVSATGPLVVSGNVSGIAATILKTGAGELILSGYNTYSRRNYATGAHGRTIIREGTVTMGSQYALGDPNMFEGGRVTIESQGTLNLNGYVLAEQQIQAGSTGTITGAGRLDFGSGSNASLDVVLSGAVGIMKAGLGTLTINRANSNTGGIDLYGGAVVLNHANALATSGTIRFRGGTLVFTAADTTDYSSRFQYITESIYSPYRIDTGGQTITFASGIGQRDTHAAGPDLIKLGEGTLVLTGSNGGMRTTINSGTIRFNNASNLGNGNSGITLNGGSLQWTAGNTADVSGNMVLNGGALDLNGNTVTLANVISGTGKLRNTGGGLLRLTARNTYTGGTLVNSGTLELGGSASSGSGIIIGDLTIENGGVVRATSMNALGWSIGSKVNTMTLNAGIFEHASEGDQGWGVAYALNNGSALISNGGQSSNSTSSKFAFGGSTSLTASGTGTSTIAGRVDLRGDGGITNVDFTVNQAATLNVTAAVTSSSGTVGFTKKGDGLLVLSGANTYNGGTIVKSGTVRFSNEGNLGTGPVTLDGGRLQWTTSNTADISSRLSLGAAGGTIDTGSNIVTFANAISGTGPLNIVNSAGSTLTLMAPDSHKGDTNLSGSLILAGPGSTHGHLGGLDGSRITLNSGTLNLSGDNVLVGTNPFSDIVLTVNSSASVYSTSYNILPTVVLDGGKFRGDSDSASLNYVFADGISTAGTGRTSEIIDSGISVASSVNVRATDHLIISARILGDNPLFKQGEGLLSLNGANSYLGNTVITGGLISFINTDAFGHAVNKINIDGGGLLWSGTADISGRLNAIGERGATFDTSGNFVTLANTISGFGAITKNGIGTLRLTASNTYIGGTVITSGTLVAAQNNALGTGRVRLEGGTLDVEDAVTFSNEVVLSGGTYRRAVTGSLIGKVNATSDLTGGIDTSARILAGNVGTQSTLVTSFMAASAASNDNIRESDIYRLVGTGANVFVLELGIDSLDAYAELGWLSNGKWINAVDGNSGNIATLPMRGYEGSYADFLLEFGSLAPSQYLGAYGYDLQGNTVWAVLNHNSDFAVIPEPGTIFLLLTSLALLAGWRSLRVRRA